MKFLILILRPHPFFPCFLCFLSCFISFPLFPFFHFFSPFFPIIPFCHIFSLLLFFCSFFHWERERDCERKSCQLPEEQINRHAHRPSPRTAFIDGVAHPRASSCTSEQPLPPTEPRSTNPTRERPRVSVAAKILRKTPVSADQRLPLQRRAGAFYLGQFRLRPGAT